MERNKLLNKFFKENFPEIKHMRVRTMKKKERPTLKFQDNRYKEKIPKYSGEKNLLIYK